MPWSLSISILALAYLGNVSAMLEVSTIEKEIEVKGKTYECTFNLEHDDEYSILYTEYSNVTCSPTALEQEVVRYVELEDDEGHFFMVDFQMSSDGPDKIIEGEYEALTPWEEFEAYEIEEIEDNKRHPCGARDQRISGNRTFLDENRGAHDAEMPIWPNGIIPYVFDYSFTKSDRLVFAKAVKKIEEKTCIKFKPRRSEELWLRVVRDCDCKKGNCFEGGWTDFLGAGSPAMLSIGKMCMSPDSSSDVGLTAHEILHNLGIGHTQTRPDRDNYIIVKVNNITPGGVGQYQKCSECKIYGTPYDCSSIMHYSDYDFMKDGPTMIAKNKETCDVSSAHERLTDADIQLMKAIYPCQDNKAVDGAWAFWSAWSTCKEGSKQRFRLCNKPKPSGGGKKCPGKNKETQKCNTNIGKKCPAFKTSTEGRTGAVEMDQEDYTQWTNSWMECATKCYHHETCVYWTWYNENDPENAYWCALMEGYSTEVSDENAVSGHYSCPEEKLCKEDNVNSQGRVQAEKMNTNTWVECAAECKKKDSCTYWTWHHEGAGFYHTRCILMEAYANKVADTNTISGSKDC